MSGRLVRQFLLGSGPLKRRTDRLHAMSRLAVLTAALAAVPVAVVVGLTVSSALHATAAAQAASRTERTATLLTDAPVATSSDGAVVVRAEWTGGDGRVRTGPVLAPSGAAAGSMVPIWLDARGRTTDPPMLGQDITAETVASAALAAIALPALAALLHLGVVQVLDRVRLRRWAEEWKSVGPLWAGRTG